MAVANFRFYEELNDILPPRTRQRVFACVCARDGGGAGGGSGVSPIDFVARIDEGAIHGKETPHHPRAGRSRSARPPLDRTARASRFR